MSTPEAAALAIEAVSLRALEKINEFAREILQTRGGRAGSGLGSLLEALWGFYVTRELRLTPGMEGFELAWFPDHAYNDFACVSTDVDWIATDRSTELLRVEAKSMYVGAEESKAHFDALQKELSDADLLLVILWTWVPIFPDRPAGRAAPQIVDFFVGPAMPVAKLRDALHEARGGTFVRTGECPDGCAPDCSHVGEPMNASGNRERRGGPESRRGSRTPNSANFGGLLRMLKTNSSRAREIFRLLRASDENAHKYISFIHRAFPSEEENQYTTIEVQRVAKELSIPTARVSVDKLWEAIRSVPEYQKAMRILR